MRIPITRKRFTPFLDLKRADSSASNERFFKRFSWSIGLIKHTTITPLIQISFDTETFAQKTRI